MKSKSQCGFTLIELIIVVAIVATLVGGVFTGNFWFTKDGVLRELKVDYPNVSHVLKSHRKVFSSSVITVENEDGSRTEFMLDADILFNYEFEETVTVPAPELPSVKVDQEDPHLRVICDSDPYTQPGRCTQDFVSRVFASL